MHKFIGLIVLSALICLLPQSAQAEAYFLRIQQKGAASQKAFLQTCTPQTAPCTFMLPVKFKGNVTKNLLVLMGFNNFSHQIDLYFYWDKTLLTTNKYRKNHYTLSAEIPGVRVFSSEIELYPPLPAGKKPEDLPDPEFSEQPIVTVNAQVTLESE